MDATIVIPTKNGGSRFAQVMQALSDQQTGYSYEVIVVDSGSSDDTVEIASAAGARVYQIPPEEFGHGKTRNLGASYGSGTYICFLTQDAVPADSHWLENMISVMDAAPEIAGAFGRHLPYPDCNLPDQQMLTLQFENYGRQGQPMEGREDVRLYRLQDGDFDRFETDGEFQQLYGFFSDNNSCLRRSVWQEIPYEDVNFSEDQIWAKTILKAGYTKAYVPGAVVYHSHDYPLREYGKRYFDDFKSVYRVYGANFAPDFFTKWRHILGDTRFQWGYIRRRTLPLKEKMHWYRYAFRRNRIRYRAAGDAVHYFTLDEKGREEMDKKYSQQYLQRRN